MTAYEQPQRDHCVVFGTENGRCVGHRVLELPHDICVILIRIYKIIFVFCCRLSLNRLMMNRQPCCNHNPSFCALVGGRLG